MSKNFEKNKQEMIDKNEQEFGEEIIKKYSEEAIGASYSKIKNMSQQQMQKLDILTDQIFQALKEAFLEGNPQSELALKVCELHKEWLCMFWSEDMYSSQAHLALVNSYLYDERFIAYYDKVEKGCTQFLYDAMCFYCQ